MYIKIEKYEELDEPLYAGRIMSEMDDSSITLYAKSTLKGMASLIKGAMGDDVQLNTVSLSEEEKDKLYKYMPNANEYEFIYGNEECEEYEDGEE